MPINRHVRHTLPLIGAIAAALLAGCRVAPATLSESPARGGTPAVPSNPTIGTAADLAPITATVAVTSSIATSPAVASSDIPLPSGEVCDDTGGTAGDPLAGVADTAAGGLPTLAIAGMSGAVSISTSAIARPSPAPSGPTPTPRPALPPGSFARPRVAVEMFSASPTQAAPGGRVVLSWRAVGEAADLHALSDQGRLSDPTPVAPSGTLEATVPEGERDVMRWVLMVRAGEARTSAEVKIALSCPFTWFFADAPSDCPAGPVETSPMAAQRFEHGLMLWSGERDTIDVLFDEGERWSFFPDDWAEGMPESDPALQPPAGRFQPLRGFGRVWRDQDGVRDGLGWATGPEIDLGRGAYQCDTNRQRVCYVTGPDGAVFVLQMGTWWKWESGGR